MLQFLSKWSARRLVVACSLWIVGAPVLAALGIILAGLLAGATSGDQKIIFSATLDDRSLGWFFVPPLLLVIAWLWAKHKKSDQGDLLSS